MKAWTEPSRGEIDALEQAAVIDFGASWCGICTDARAAIAQTLARLGGGA